MNHMPATQSPKQPTPKSSTAKWIQHHKRSLLFLLLMLTLSGIIAALNLPVTLFPRVDFPRVVVSLDAGDRPVESMVLDVTIPTENAIRQVPNVRNVRSTSSRGSAEISVNFDWNSDMTAATLQINQAISQLLPTLPNGTQMTVRRMDPTVFPILAYSLRSDNLSLSELRLLALGQLRPLLSTVDGVARVEVIGGTQDEYQVIADPNQLKTLGLSLNDLSTALTTANIVNVVGRLEDQYKLFLVMTNSPLKNAEDIGNVVVRASTDGLVLVKDIALIQKQPATQTTRVNADGQNAVLLNIYQQPTANSIQLAQSVATKLSDADLPNNIHVQSWYDQSQLVSASARSVIDAILIGMLLAGLVLLLFLRNLKITLIAVLMVPVVLLLTTILLSLLNMSFNIMTLGGMAAAVGLIIDDAIVMVEHLIRRLHEGSIADTDSASQSVISDTSSDANLPPQAVIATTGIETDVPPQQLRPGILDLAQEYLRPLAGSSASTIVIFLPLAFLTGVTGAFFKALSLTMATGLLISFLMTWLILPTLIDLFFTARDVKPHQPSQLADKIANFYRKTLGTLLAKPLLILLFIIPLLGLGTFAFTRVGSGFMPALDEGGFVLDYTMPPGTSLAETDRVLQQVEQIIQKDPNVQTYSRRTGIGLGGGLNEANQGDFFVRLKPLPRMPIEPIIENLRGEIEQKVPGLQIEFAQLMEDMIGDLTAVPQPVEIKLFTDDPATLQQVAKKTAEAIGHVDGIVDVNSGIIPAGDAIEIQVDPARAALAGMTTDYINQALQDAMAGHVATQINPVSASIGQIPVRVWIPESQRQTLLDLNNLPLYNANGLAFTVQDMAQITPVSGQLEVSREQQQRMVAVTARISGRDLGSVVKDVQAMLLAKGFLPNNVRLEIGGLYAQQQIAFRGLMMVFVTAAALVFLLLLFIYERFSIAISILTMPLLAASSVFIGLWLTGIELNISAMMGMTMIIGIVTEVAIFYFSEYFKLQTQSIQTQSLMHGKQSNQIMLLIDAGQNRMRPIFMTTLAAILTLLPLAFALGEGSAMQQPLAIAIISGLVVQLPLVLLVMPVFFYAISHRKVKQRDGDDA